MTPKVILLTGASSGIGYNTALQLAAHGHTVYAAARRVERMQPLEAHGIHIIRMDVENEQSMVEGVQHVMQREGRLDVLVNNAGYGYFGPIETVSMDEARRQLEVNLFGLARLTQLVLPIMRQQGSGRIVNTSSIAGKMVFYMGGWYHVSKYSVEALSDALRIEMRPLGVDVVMVEPGPIRTDWGLIAADHLRESTTATPYEAAAATWADSMHRAYERHLFSQPQAVTKAIVRAVESRHPRSRYLAGRYAHLALALRCLPTRWYDALMRSASKVHIR